MKNLLKIFLISSSLYACGNSEVDSASNPERDTLSGQDSARNEYSDNNDNKSFHYPDPSDLEKETVRQITSALLSSQEEIILLRSEISESLSKPGLTDEKEVLFRKTILQLEKSSDMVNKQLEEILVKDLQNSREKLNGIVKNMKASEKELGTMIARLDKITGYMQLACSLIQSLVPVPSTPVSSKTSKQ
jgi:hypothetical protein